MPTTRKTCRVCGKEYEACHTAKRETSGFRWQEVACSPECGSEYLRQVTEARNPKPKRVKAKSIQTEEVFVPSVMVGETPAVESSYTVVASTEE